MCQDFRELNKITVSDPYPIPRVDELLERAARARFMSTLDLAKGYYQVPITETDKHKTAFLTTTGKYEYNTLPFGLKNGPAIFQRLMDRQIPEASAYIDDILVTSDTWQEHLVHLKKTLSALRDAGLTSKLKKCVFIRSNIDFLGHCIGRGHLKPQTAKTKAIADFKIPKRKKHFRTFLGLSGYYRKFIPQYAHTTAVLTDLLRKKSPDILPWESKHQEAFEKIKTQLSFESVLVAPNHDKTLPWSHEVEPWLHSW